MTRLLDMFIGKGEARRSAFRRVFMHGDDAKLVMAEMAKFCFAARTTEVAGDARASAINEGRRQVFLWAAKNCNMSDAEIRQIAEQNVQIQNRNNGDGQ